MKKFGFLKCEVQLRVNQTNKDPKKRILIRMADDKSLRIGLDCRESNIIVVQLATTIREEGLSTDIFEYLLSVVMYEWLEEITILSLSFSEQQHSITKFDGVKLNIENKKCTTAHSLSDDESPIPTLSDTKKENVTKAMLEEDKGLTFSSSTTVSTRLEQFKHVYYSQLVKQIDRELQSTKSTKTKSTVSATRSTVSSTNSNVSNTSKTRPRSTINTTRYNSNPISTADHKNLVKFYTIEDVIKPEDSASNITPNQYSMQIKSQSCKRKKGILELASHKLDRDTVKRWTKEEIKELLINEEVGLCFPQDIVDSIDITGYDLDAVIRKMEQFGGNSLSCDEYFGSMPERTLTLSHLDNRIRVRVVNWLTSNMVLFEQ